MQRTADGETFVDIAKIKGAGTTAGANSYSTLDNRPLTGKVYYRLKQSDFDGNFSYSKLVAVDVPDYGSWTLYPNPSNGSDFSIGLSSGDLGKTAYIKVQDLSGKELFQMVSENLTSTQVKIEIPQKLAGGLYILSLAIEQQIVRYKLIVRE